MVFVLLAFSVLIISPCIVITNENKVIYSSFKLISGCVMILCMLSCSKESQNTYEKLSVNTKVKSDSILIEGETDLPDNSVISINIRRGFVLKGEQDEMDAAVSGFKKSIVRDGKFSSICLISNDGLNELPIDFFDSCVKKINTNVVVEISFSPNSICEGLQPNDVTEKIGQRGERLSGKLVDVFGKATDSPSNTLKTDVSIEFPYVNGSHKNVFSKDEYEFYKLEAIDLYKKIMVFKNEKIS